MHYTASGIELQWRSCLQGCAGGHSVAKALQKIDEGGGGGNRLTLKIVSRLPSPKVQYQ